MEQIFRTSKYIYKLKRGSKYTTLYRNQNGKYDSFAKWDNEDLSIVMKTNDFDKQTEWFKQNLK